MRLIAAVDVAFRRELIGPEMMRPDPCIVVELACIDANTNAEEWCWVGWKEEAEGLLAGIKVSAAWSFLEFWLAARSQKLNTYEVTKRSSS
ncbi:hypothetical protein DENSPDRAFT_418355 [Dentipellis sp. KUC8613]|nr:hypothetical protein DENSPDRAFT_418355 [Dentipellis sp. KUC8613]